jgi:hypothetical protein
MAADICWTSSPERPGVPAGRHRDVLLEVGQRQPWLLVADRPRGLRALVEGSYSEAALFVDLDRSRSSLDTITKVGVGLLVLEYLHLGLGLA